MSDNYCFACLTACATHPNGVHCPQGREKASVKKLRDKKEVTGDKRTKSVFEPIKTGCAECPAPAR